MATPALRSLPFPWLCLALAPHDAACTSLGVNLSGALEGLVE